MAPVEPLHVEVVYCSGPGCCDLVALTLPPGATLQQALHGSGMLARHGLAMEGLLCGVWGKLREPAHELRERDRVEIYRPLQVDPKEARRLRYKGHKERRAAGGKAAPPIK
jgi:putative ubiquitin-RnfH superfamily antitoxin RatB of RatAB toxin-antitoxin module